MTTAAAGGLTNCRNRVHVWVSVQTPEFLGNPQRKSLSHRTSPVQGPVQQQTPLISGNKGGRVSWSSKIAWGEGGVEGCEGSDVTSHIAAGAWSQLKPFAAAKSARYEGIAESEGKQGVGLLTEGSATMRLKTWLWRTVWTLVNGTASAVRYEVTAWQTVALVVASTSWPNKPQCFPWLTFPLRCHTWWEELALVVSLGGGDYITNLVKLTMLFYLYFRSQKYLHIWVLDYSHVRVFS